VFGPWQLVLTVIVVAFVRFVQAPYTVFDAPRTLGDKVALTELALCVMVMALVVAMLQWRLGAPRKGELAP
jgi:branched-subunit amino acid transport protein AzlD